jgi:hypothetical protein
MLIKKGVSKCATEVTFNLVAQSCNMGNSAAHALVKTVLRKRKSWEQQPWG